MQRNVAPVADHARAWLAPWVAALSRQIIPMEWFGIEFTFWPSWKATHHITLTNVLPLSARSMGWLRKDVLKRLVGAHAHKENATSILRHAVVLRVEHRPFHSISRRTIADQLIPQQVAVLTEHHPVDIFDYKRLRQYLAQDAIEFAIEIISVVSLPFALAALCVALTGIASD